MSKCVSMSVDFGITFYTLPHRKLLFNKFRKGVSIGTGT